MGVTGGERGGYRCVWRERDYHGDNFSLGAEICLRPVLSASYSPPGTQRLVLCGIGEGLLNLQWIEKKENATECRIDECRSQEHAAAA